MKRSHEVLERGGIFPVVFPDPFSLKPQPGTEGVGGGSIFTGIGGGFDHGGGHWEGDPPQGKEWESPEHEAAHVFYLLWDDKIEALSYLLRKSPEEGSIIFENLLTLALTPAHITDSSKKYIAEIGKDSILDQKKTPNEIYPILNLGIKLIYKDGKTLIPALAFRPFGIFEDSPHLETTERDLWALRMVKARGRLVDGAVEGPIMRMKHEIDAKYGEG